MRCKQAVHAFVMILLAGPVTACVAPGLESTSRAQEIGTDSDELPEVPPAGCEILPRCSLTYEGGYIHPLQAKLRCSQTYAYRTGGSGFGGGQGSFCPDFPAVRTGLHDAHFVGYTSDYCGTCLDIPVGKLFVFWTVMDPPGPGCPSSCVDLPSGF